MIKSQFPNPKSQRGVLRTFKNVGIWSLGFGIFLLGFGISSSHALPFRDTVNKGNDSYKNKDFEKSTAFYNEALKSKNNQIAKFNLGDSLYKQGKFEESKQVFQTLTNEVKSKKLKAASLYNLGNSYFRQQDYNNAIKGYESALSIEAKDADARYNLELARKMLKEKKKEKKNNKKENEQKNEKEKKSKPQQNKSGMSKEDAQRILQSITDGEKHKAKPVKGGGSNDKDW